VERLRLDELEGLEAIEAETAKDPRDSRLRDAGLPGDLRACPALPPQSLNPCHDFGRCGPVQTVRPGRAVFQAGNTFRPEPPNPLPHRARADAYGLADSCGVCPPSTTRRTIASRPAGVSRAFL
jgi:hypothetical protein